MEFPGFARSHPVTFFAGIANAPSGLLFTNERANSMAVLTFVSLVNITNGAGDAIVLSGPATSSTSNAFHSGSVGAGVFDRFPLECEIAYLPSQTIGYELASGTWGVTLVGYYTPLIFTT